MFARIPVFRKNPDLLNSGLEADRSLGSPAELTVRLRPSRYLWWAQLLVHGLLAISLSFALVPFFAQTFNWFLLWLSAIFGLGVSAHFCRKSSQKPSQIFSITQDIWLLNGDGKSRRLVPSDDAVVWSWLVVLPCRDKDSHARVNLVVALDSTSAEEHRRLRVWLRTRHMS